MRKIYRKRGKRNKEKKKKSELWKEVTWVCDSRGECLVRVMVDREETLLLLSH